MEGPIRCSSLTLEREEHLTKTRLPSVKVASTSQNESSSLHVDTVLRWDMRFPRRWRCRCFSGMWRLRVHTASQPRTTQTGVEMSATRTVGPNRIYELRLQIQSDRKVTQPIPNTCSVSSINVFDDGVEELVSVFLDFCPSLLCSFKATTFRGMAVPPPIELASVCVHR
jgi:hypothetical protein